MVNKNKNTNKGKVKATKRTVSKDIKKNKFTSEDNLYSSHRKLKLPKYKSFRLQKKIKYHQPKLSTAPAILKKSLTLLKLNKRIYLGILAVNLLLLLVLVNNSRNGLDISGLKDSLDSLNPNNGTSVLNIATLFGILVSSSSGSSDTANSGAGIYQSIIMIIISISSIWATRQLLAKQVIKVKDSFYKSMTPVIPFVLTLFIIGLQLIPMAIGSWLYSQLIVGGIAVNAIEIVISSVFIFLLILLSSYMLISSIFAPFIVTLPNMTPMIALRSARQLVKHRRLIVLRKLLFLPLFLLIAAAVIMLPFLVYLPSVAEFVFFVISSLGWIFSIIYMYNLYRELLNE